MDTAELSKLLYMPGAVLLYVAAVVAYAVSMANRVERSAESRRGVRAERAGLALASLGIAAHLGHLVTRSIAAGGRVPWGTMFEYASVLSFVVAVAAVAVFHLRLRRPEITTFVLLGAVLWMGLAIATFGEPEPLQPILNSSWLVIHVFAMMVSFAIFTLSFVTNGLYLLRERAESRVTSRGGTALRGTGTLSAAANRDPVTPDPVTPDPVTPDPVTPDPVYASDTLVDARPAGEVELELDGVEPTHGKADALDGFVAGGVDGTSIGARSAEVRADLRGAVSPVPGALLMAVLGLALAALFDEVLLYPLYAIAGVASAYAVWWAVPYLPDAATLDALTYRVSSFGFPILTFGILSGAVWAEQSWGRYWGWDPKETSAFLTWVAYASYLHARATRGVRGRNAAYVLFGAYAILLFTFYVVNLVVVGLHSYAQV